VGFYTLNKEQYTESLYNKSSLITQIYRDYLQSKSDESMFINNLKTNNLAVIDNSNEIELILYFGEKLKSKRFDAIFERRKYSRLVGVYTEKLVHNMLITMLEYNSKIYFLLQLPDGQYLMEDSYLKVYSPLYITSFFAIVFAIITMAFSLIFLKLKPLASLRRKIASFGAGNMHVDFSMKGEDEIAIISNELGVTQNKINSLIESRTLFLRNIMHELKTPIAKGRIVTQMLHDEKQKSRYESIFERLELLIKEFALIEEISTGNYINNTQEYRIIDLIDGAKDMAMIENSNIVTRVPTDAKISVDYKVFVTAIKNIIDNAMKYSPNKKVYISFEYGNLLFRSIGNELDKDLSYYIEPFTKSNSSRDSFGLGLYLVDSILKAHQMKLEYTYENNENCFIFKL
jgi:two-component system, OmpR family, sensor kinase